MARPCFLQRRGRCCVWNSFATWSPGLCPCLGPSETKTRGTLSDTPWIRSVTINPNDEKWNGEGDCWARRIIGKTWYKKRSWGELLLGRSVDLEELVVEQASALCFLGLIAFSVLGAVWVRARVDFGQFRRRPKNFSTEEGGVPTERWGHPEGVRGPKGGGAWKVGGGGGRRLGVDAPKGGAPKCRSFFCPPSRPSFRSILVSVEVFSLNVGGVFDAGRGPQKHASCERVVPGKGGPGKGRVQGRAVPDPQISNAHSPWNQHPHPETSTHTETRTHTETKHTQSHTHVHTTHNTRHTHMYTHVHTTHNNTQHTTHNTQHTTHNTQHTTHNTQHTTHNTTTHNTQHTTHNTQHTTHNTQHTQHTTHNTQHTKHTTHNKPGRPTHTENMIPTSANLYFGLFRLRPNLYFGPISTPANSISTNWPNFWIGWSRIGRSRAPRLARPSFAYATPDFCPSSPAPPASLGVCLPSRTSSVCCTPLLDSELLRTFSIKLCFRSWSLQQSKRPAQCRRTLTSGSSTLVWTSGCSWNLPSLCHTCLLSEAPWSNLNFPRIFPENCPWYLVTASLGQSSLHSELRLISLTSQASIMVSALNTFVILIVLRIWEIASTHGIKVLGIGVVLIFRLSRLLLVTALTSPVVLLNRTLCSVTDICCTMSSLQRVSWTHRTMFFHHHLQHLRLDFFDTHRHSHRRPPPDRSTSLKSFEFLKMCAMSQYFVLEFVSLFCSHWISWVRRCSWCMCARRSAEL